MKVKYASFSIGLRQFYSSLQPMKIFKFGGASVSTAERIRNVAQILKKYENEKLLVVVSAMGKTTNALEKVVEAFYAGEKEKALQLFNDIKQQHLDILNQLLNPLTTPTHYSPLTIPYSPTSLPK